MIRLFIMLTAFTSLSHAWDMFNFRNAIGGWSGAPEQKIVNCETECSAPNCGEGSQVFLDRCMHQCTSRHIKHCYQAAARQNRVLLVNPTFRREVAKARGQEVNIKSPAPVFPDMMQKQTNMLNGPVGGYPTQGYQPQQGGYAPQQPVYQQNGGQPGYQPVY
jgi:hypothetical protein